MREILFKAKRTDNKEWVFGYYVQINGKHFIVPDYASAWYGIEVEPSTVCQYTGLTDKNGNKIFDGDKIKHLEWIFTIIFIKGYCEFSMICKELPKGPHVFHEGIALRCEVIGNIHDKEE